MKSICKNLQSVEVLLFYRYLNKTISDNSAIRSQDLSTVYSAVYGNSYGVSVLFQFLKDNYKILPN